MSAPAPTTVDDLLRQAAHRAPSDPALWRDETSIGYAETDARVDRMAAWLRVRFPLRGSRVAVWLDKRVDTVVTLFAAVRAGHVAVPVNPALRAQQVLACLDDCRAAALVSDTARLQALDSARAGLAGAVTETGGSPSPTWQPVDLEAPDWVGLFAVSGNAAAPALPALERDGDELALLFYTSGSTGAPKGVMVTHANLLAGAAAVNAYLGNGPRDRLLAALPLSFDAGFSQLTTAFAAGASVVLLDHLFPADVLAAMERHAVTGLTAVPPLYLQLLAALQRAGPQGTESAGRALRYFANTGGHLPREAWQVLRQRWPQAQPVAMYGLTEAFRASWLPPADFDRKPDSVGLAIPGGTRLHVLRADGSACGAAESGELVQQGPLVARGYWNDPARSRLRFRPGPDGEPAVWSGDTVRRDAEGYLWFVGRDDEQIKTSGYRVSPTEIETAAAQAGWPECVAVGVPDAALGQAIVLVVASSGPGAHPGRTEAARHADPDRTLMPALRAALPAWMVPRRIEAWDGPLPRNLNGKFDRVLIRQKTLQRAARPQPDHEGDGND